MSALPSLRSLYTCHPFTHGGCRPFYGYAIFLSFGYGPPHLTTVSSAFKIAYPSYLYYFPDASIIYLYLQGDPKIGEIIDASGRSLYLSHHRLRHEVEVEGTEREVSDKRPTLRVIHPAHTVLPLSLPFPSSRLISFGYDDWSETTCNDKQKSRMEAGYGDTRGNTHVGLAQSLLRSAPSRSFVITISYRMP